MRILRRELPALRTPLERIPEPRNPKKCRHRLTVLLRYGLLMFVFQFASRREVNRELTRPQIEANLRLLFPELETLPHVDTLLVPSPSSAPPAQAPGSTLRGCAACWPSRCSFSSNKRHRAGRRTRSYRRPPVPGTVCLAIVTLVRGLGSTTPPGTRQGVPWPPW